MPTYIVHRVKPVMVSCTFDADDERAAIETAIEIWKEDADDADAYTAEEQ